MYKEKHKWPIKFVNVRILQLIIINPTKNNTADQTGQNNKHF